MESRKTLLKSARARAARLKKRGFSVSDVGALSTQKLVALKKMSPKQFEAAIATGYTYQGRKISYKEYKEEKLAKLEESFAAKAQERARAEAIRKINRRVKGFQAAGYTVSGLSTADIVSMPTKDLIAFAAQSRSDFFSSLGATKEVDIKPLFGKGPKNITVEAAKWSKYIDLLKKRNQAAREAGVYAPDIDIFTSSEEGFERLLDFIEKQSTAEYWSDYELEYRRRFIVSLEKWADYLPEVAYIVNRLKRAGETEAREQASILQRANKAGIDVASINYIYQGDISGSVALLYKLFRIKPYKGDIHDNQKGT